MDNRLELLAKKEKKRLKKILMATAEQEFLNVICAAPKGKTMKRFEMDIIDVKGEKRTNAKLCIESCGKIMFEYDSHVPWTEETIRAGADCFRIRSIQPYMEEINLILGTDFRICTERRRTEKGRFEFFRLYLQDELYLNYKTFFDKTAHESIQYITTNEQAFVTALGMIVYSIWYGQKQLQKSGEEAGMEEDA